MGRHVISPFDLHTHSTVSDGLLTPAQLVAEASQLGISVLSLTDHDTLGGLSEAIGAGETHGVTIIPGVELSAEAGSHEIHILGYFVDPSDPVLEAALSGNARNRVLRIERIVGRLRNLGLQIEMNRVLEIAGDGTVGRPHVARALIESGYVVSITEAFDRYLASGRPGFVPRLRSSPVDSVRLIREAGAVPVLAHPLSTGDVERTLQQLVPAGLLGIEVYYGEYPAETHRLLRSIADQWQLIPTGGSDYHGPGFREGRDLGSAPVPAESVIRLRQSWEALRGESFPTASTGS